MPWSRKTPPLRPRCVPNLLHGFPASTHWAGDKGTYPGRMNVPPLRAPLLFPPLSLFPLFLFPPSPMLLISRLRAQNALR